MSLGKRALASYKYGLTEHTEMSEQCYHAEQIERYSLQPLTYPEKAYKMQVGNISNKKWATFSKILSRDQDWVVEAAKSRAIEKAGELEQVNGSRIHKWQKDLTLNVKI